jgi:aspartyl-tRNA(Asn)/glutamyl-tRNA(Gln) amidotransferase subunit C
MAALIPRLAEQAPGGIVRAIIAVQCAYRDNGETAALELSRDEVRRIAELAKLELTDEEVDLYTGQLTHILQYFQKLQEVDTSHIAPTASVLPLTNVFREDVPAPPLTPAQVVANAQTSLDDQFLVSSVLDD